MAGRRNADIPRLASKESYFDFFDGATVTVPDELDKRRLPGGLLKSYVLETVTGSSRPNMLERILERSGLHCEAIDSDQSLYRIVDQRRQGIAVAESFNDRYLALYTLLPSQRSDSLVRKAVASNPMLDHIWLSSQTFRALWGHIRAVNSGRRYGRITFEHESLFDLPVDSEEPDGFEDERRASRFTMVDRLEEIARQMEPLQRSYAPLHSITHMRIPADSRGGHDLYYDGKVTNRSDSFLDHRNSLRYVVDVYSRLTTKVEDRLWFSESDDGDGFGLQGSVAELIFSEPLSDSTFRRWVMTLFNRRRNRFRISGFHTWLGDRKVHANAIDQHLWQPIILELTPERVLAVLPKGTCGNTVNRLISNVQRFVDPDVHAYIGDSEYGELVPREESANVA